MLDSTGEEQDPSRDRQDPTPRLRHPVTGELVPDRTKKLEYRTMVSPRETEWPPAELIIGNPTFMGQFWQCEAFGDGYVGEFTRRGAMSGIGVTADPEPVRVALEIPCRAGTEACPTRRETATA